MKLVRFIYSDNIYYTGVAVFTTEEEYDFFMESLQDALYNLENYRIPFAVEGTEIVFHHESELRNCYTQSDITPDELDGLIELMWPEYIDEPIEERHNGTYFCGIIPSDLDFNEYCDYCNEIRKYN